MNDNPIYLDSASTTPVDKRVLDAMFPYFSDMFGNASSSHRYGEDANKAIESARFDISELINSSPREIKFTSGSTEAINWAIKGYLQANPSKGNHIITVKTEHKAVLDTCEFLESRGYEVTYMDVNSEGIISMDELKSSIKPSTSLIAVMYVNNETGVIQDIAGIGQIAQNNGIAFFCDATQAVGKVPVDVRTDKIDLLCISGHKIGGPKGVGALYIKQGVELEPLIHGGGQEEGLRGGTYNTPGIVGLGIAARISKEEFYERTNYFRNQTQLWQSEIENRKIGQVNFKNVERAPHILSISLKNSSAREFLLKNSKEFVASTGSACNSRLLEESHVVKAIGFEPDRTIRISF